MSTSGVWTDTGTDGKSVSIGALSCTDWTIADDEVGGFLGSATSVLSSWTFTGGAVECEQTRRLYCF